MNCATHPAVPATAYCRTCGKALCEACKRDVKGVIYCQECLAARLEGTVPPAAQVPGGTPIGAVPVSPPGTPNPALATILGFIPGVGAFYNGQFAKGFIHVLVFAILIKLTDASDIFGLAIAAWYFYMVFDAYKTAKAKQLGLPLPDPLGLNSLFGISEGASHVSRPMPPVQPASGEAPAAANVVPESYSSPPMTYQQPPAYDYRYRRGPTGAVILIGLGVLFLLNNLGLFRWGWTGRYWPVILIIVGLYVAAKRMSDARHQEPPQ